MAIVKDYPVINLDAYKVAGSSIFVGRENGKYVREKSKIDQLASAGHKIELVIPNDVHSVNPSFLEEFLGNVVHRLGKTAFTQQVRIVNNGKYKIDSDLDEAIDRILGQNRAAS